MPEINCPNVECDQNKPHPSGHGQTCGLTIMSQEKQPDGRWGCEYWESLISGMRCEYCGDHHDTQIDECHGREVRCCRNISECSARMVEKVIWEAREGLKNNPTCLLSKYS